MTFALGMFGRGLGFSTSLLLLALTVEELAVDTLAITTHDSLRHLERQGQSPILLAYEHMLTSPHLPSNRPQRPIEDYDFEVIPPGDAGYMQVGIEQDPFTWGDSFSTWPWSPGFRSQYRLNVVRKPNAMHKANGLLLNGDGGEYYRLAINFKKGHLACTHLYKGRRDERPLHSPSDGQVSRSIPASDLLWHAYHEASIKARYSLSHPPPPLRWLYIPDLKDERVLNRLEQIWNMGHTLVSHRNERVWHYSSPAARAILTETLQGKRILYVLTQHADTLGRRQIQAVGLAKSSGNYYLKIQLVDAVPLNTVEPSIDGPDHSMPFSGGVHPGRLRRQEQPES